MKNLHTKSDILHKRWFKQVLYFSVLLMLAGGIFYYFTPRFYIRGIALHQSKDKVLSLEENEFQNKPASMDEQNNTVLYKDITFKEGVMGTIEYSFSDNDRLESIFFMFPITDNVSEVLRDYVVKTFSVPKKELQLSRGSSYQYTKKSTHFSLFHADNSDNYCVRISWRF